ncbi:unnamed protein product [Lactuca saligna]|uniref:Uncharacterized protein n=1 Tax=Lactuca saligna TaxID=75948 RepID=A0AA35V760_LACSI|nr:unnamed protein product [Lactuca saligna]
MSSAEAGGEESVWGGQWWRWLCIIGLVIIGDDADAPRRSPPEITCPSLSTFHQPEDAIEKFFNVGRCEGRHSTVLRSSPVIGSKEDQGEDPPVLIFVGLRRRSTIGIRNREALPLIHRFEGGG